MRDWRDLIALCRRDYEQLAATNPLGCEGLLSFPPSEVEAKSAQLINCIQLRLMAGKRSRYLAGWAP